MVALGGQFLLGFLVGVVAGPFIIGIAKDIIGGVVNMAQGAVGMQATQVGVVTQGYSGTEKEDSWIG